MAHLHNGAWRAQWRDASGQRHTRTFKTQEEARAHDRDMKRKYPPARAHSELSRDEVRDWLRGHLQEGPRHVRTLLAAAKAEGVAGKSTLYAVSHELGVERSEEGWRLTADPPPIEASRACVRCGRLLPPEDFPASSWAKSSDGRSSTCQPCSDRRERLRSNGGLQGVAAANQLVGYAPDPAPAQHLRQHLAVMRRRETPFDRAWRASLEVALAGLPKDEHKSWKAAFQATRGAWHRGYLRQDVAEHPLFVREPEGMERVAA